jgi:molybdopterin biosynthesis enzyme
VKGYAGSQCSLTATHRGLLKVRIEALSQVNALEGVSIFALFDGQPVQTGEVVAKAKVTPLAIASTTIAEAERVAGKAGGVLGVSPFTPLTIGAVARESLEEKQRQRFEAALKEKIDWFGSRLLPVHYADESPRSVAKELEALRDSGAQLLIVAGASALDPLDPVFAALDLLGAQMQRHGAPAHPGSLLWLARWGERPIVGMPTCGMFSQATTFDLVLPRILAGQAVGNAELAALGHGGLLSREMAFRFPPYRASAPRGELE